MRTPSTSEVSRAPTSLCTMESVHSSRITSHLVRVKVRVRVRVRARVRVKVRVRAGARTRVRG